MNKEKAIEYLKGKDEYNDDEEDAPLTKEEKVEKVMKEGKIYGDPTADIDM